MLSHLDAARHGFPYAAWQFDDDVGGAENYHDANHLTFHRLRGFRACLDRSVD